MSPSALIVAVIESKLRIYTLHVPLEVEVVLAKISEDQVSPKIHSKAGVC